MVKKVKEYRKLNDIEHVLLRPGMWIGSTVNEIKNVDVFDGESFIKKEIEYVPAILKIFDEIISNSVDEHIVTKNSKSINKLDKIVIEHSSDGTFKCWDNGGIPVEKHSAENVYIPELIFGNLRSGSNFNDDEDRNGAGLNGVGSTLANIFSKEFSISTSDGKNKIDIKWTNNMSNKSKPKISKCSDNYTKISCKIDLDYFNINELPSCLGSVVEKRCMVAAASNPGLTVVFNDNSFSFKSFEDYLKLYPESQNLIGEVNSDWNIYMIPKPFSQGGNYHGIVNGSECNHGSHIDMLVDNISTTIDNILKKSNVDLPKRQIKQQFDCYICMSVNKPIYDAQTKDKLTNNLLKEDGSKLLFSNSFKEKIKSSGIIEKLIELYNSKENELERAEISKIAKKLNKQNIKYIKKLIDCSAKTKQERQNASIFLFEGESAGNEFRSAREPKYHAAYLLKGKVKNTIGVKTIDVLKNEEFSQIISILGLDPRKPDDISKIRYKRIVITTDADEDGNNIAGGIIAFFLEHFPKIIESGMLYKNITPIGRAIKPGNITKYFYSFNNFKEFVSNNKGWKTSYFKGIGSLEKSDFKSMLMKPTLERYKVSNRCMETVYDWLGPDSSKRKKYLEAPEVF